MENVELDALIGKSLDDRFELKKLIGQGGYGAVFEAVQTSMERRCAVKVLSFQTDDPKEVARFELEARVTCQLTHPNTIVVYEYGRDETLGVFFIAMEFLDGQSLTELSNSRTLSIDEMLHILSQVADSLDDAHRYNLVHRDIKPHNIMIVKRGTEELCVKVIDFGIAKTQEKGLHLTQTDTIIGTPEYMSTEQVLNKPLSGKSDQYALAVTAYYLFTGRTLFNCDTALQTAVAHASETPPAISTVSDRFLVSQLFDAALLKALAKEPDLRFDNCRDFVDMLIANKPKVNPDSAKHSFSNSERKLSTMSFAHAVAKTEVAPANPVSDMTPQSENKLQQQATSGSLQVFQKPKTTNTVITILIVCLFTIAVVLVGIIIWMPKEDTTLAEVSDVAQKEKSVNLDLPPKTDTKEQAKEPIVVEKILQPNEEVPKKAEQISPAVKKPIIAKTKPTPKQKAISQKVSETLKTAKAIEKKTVKKVEKAKPTGTAKIVISPWGDIYVDGKKRSSKSRFTTKLTAGKHTFVLKQEGVTKSTKRLEVKAGEVLRVRLSAD